jgi:hypothetical protein
MSHQPKAGMCASCKHRDSDCSKLPFSTMPVIKKYMDGVIQVRCTEFKRLENKDAE